MDDNNAAMWVIIIVGVLVSAATLMEKNKKGDGDSFIESIGRTGTLVFFGGIVLLLLLVALR